MVTRACNAISVGFEIGVLRKECIGWFSCNVSYVQVIIIICLYYTLPKPFTCSLPHPIRAKKQTYELTHPVTHPPRSRRILVILVYMLCYAMLSWVDWAFGEILTLGSVSSADERCGVDSTYRLGKHDVRN